MLGLWRSEPLRASHAEGGFVHELVEQFAVLPRLFCDSTDDRLERAHFCSWWGVTMNRTYDNPAIEDLYRLHADECLASDCSSRARRKPAYTFAA